MLKKKIFHRILSVEENNFKTVKFIGYQFSTYNFL